MEEMSGMGKCGTKESMGATVDDLIRHATETRQAMRETTAPRVPRSLSRVSRPDGGNDNTHRAFDGCPARGGVNFSGIVLFTVRILSGPELLLVVFRRDQQKTYGQDLWLDVASNEVEQHMPARRVDGRYFNLHGSWNTAPHATVAIKSDFIVLYQTATPPRSISRFLHSWFEQNECKCGRVSSQGGVASADATHPRAHGGWPTEIDVIFGQRFSASYPVIPLALFTTTSARISPSCHYGKGVTCIVGDAVVLLL